MSPLEPTCTAYRIETSSNCSNGCTRGILSPQRRLSLRPLPCYSSQAALPAEWKMVVGSRRATHTLPASQTSGDINNDRRRYRRHRQQQQDLRGPQAQTPASRCRLPRLILHFTVAAPRHILRWPLFFQTTRAGRLDFAKPIPLRLRGALISVPFVGEKIQIQSLRLAGGERNSRVQPQTWP